MTLATTKVYWVALSVFYLLPLAVAHAETPHKAKPESLQAWRDARFGMFIHWGPVSRTAKEISWSRANSNPQCPNRGATPVAVYDNLYKRFDPVKFDAKQWVAVAQAAGMKYMVLTAKHCDGFLLWDSKVDDYNIMHTPLKRDVCAELAKAAHEAGMKLGWYFSPMDWRDPDCRTAKNAEFVKRMQAELTELLSNYGKIDILWFDWDARSVPWDQPNTYALVRRLQPDIVINNRLDSTRHFPAGQPDCIGPWADFYTPEQRIGGLDNQRPWESCMTVSAHNQWAWGGAKDGVKSYKVCMGMLLHCAGGDGNMLLNVGPTPSGEIAPEQANLVKEMGTWLAKYGESIYGTRGGPYTPGTEVTSTRKGNIVYLHILDWPKTGDLRLPALPATIKSATLLTGGQVEVTPEGSDLVIKVAPEHRQTIDTLVKLELDKPALDIAPIKLSAPAAPARKKRAKN